MKLAAIIYLRQGIATRTGNRNLRRLNRQLALRRRGELVVVRHIIVAAVQHLEVAAEHAVVVRCRGGVRTVRCCVADTCRMAAQQIAERLRRDRVTVLLATVVRRGRVFHGNRHRSGRDGERAARRADHVVRVTAQEQRDGVIALGLRVSAAERVVDGRSFNLTHDGGRQFGIGGRIVVIHLRLVIHIHRHLLRIHRQCVLASSRGVVRVRGADLHVVRTRIRDAAIRGSPIRSIVYAIFYINIVIVDNARGRDRRIQSSAVIRLRLRRAWTAQGDGRRGDGQLHRIAYRPSHRVVGVAVVAVCLNERRRVFAHVRAARHLVTVVAEVACAEARCAARRSHRAGETLSAAGVRLAVAVAIHRDGHGRRCNRQLHRIAYRPGHRVVGVAVLAVCLNKRRRVFAHVRAFRHFIAGVGEFACIEARCAARRSHRASEALFAAAVGRAAAITVHLDGHCGLRDGERASLVGHMVVALVLRTSRGDGVSAHGLARSTTHRVGDRVVVERARNRRRKGGIGRTECLAVVIRLYRHLFRVDGERAPLHRDVVVRVAALRRGYRDGIRADILTRSTRHRVNRVDTVRRLASHRGGVGGWIAAVVVIRLRGIVGLDGDGHLIDGQRTVCLVHVELSRHVIVVGVLHHGCARDGVGVGAGVGLAHASRQAAHRVCVAVHCEAQRLETGNCFRRTVIIV